MNFIEVIGYIPALIFPVATIIQVVYLLKSKSSNGVSATTWGAFALGNLALYLYTEKYDAIQSIVGQLVTAFIQIYIVFLVLKYRKQAQANQQPELAQ